MSAFTASTSSNNAMSPRANVRSPTAMSGQSSLSTSTQQQQQQTFLTTGSVPSEVTHLFRTKRVSDIRQFESRIRVEAEEKSESLRHLLGTRYRDLLLAADSISSMCDGATTSVRDALHTVCNTSAKLRDELNVRASPVSPKTHQHDRNIVDPSSSKDADLARRRSIHAVGSRLKHIVDSPEVLYAYLEAGELYEAACRFVIAQSNYNDIIDSPSDEETVASKFAHTRWRLVSSFKSQIVTAAEKRLVTSGLGVEDYARVFASIVLLKGEQCDVVEVANMLLSARTTWLEEVRHRHERGNDAGDAMRNIAIVVRDTVACMSALFWRVKKQNKHDQRRTDENENFDNGVEELVKVVDEKCAQRIVQARERGGLNGAVVAWTSNVRAWLQSNGDALLATATTSRQVALALKAIDDVLSEKSWAADCQAVLQQTPEFVFDIFKPFISARAGVVAEECVQLAVKRVLADVGAAWDDVEGVSDVGKGMWTAMSGQAVNLGDNGVGGVSQHYGGRDRLRSASARDMDEERDVAKMLVYNGAVAGVVDTFEASMKEALADVKALAQRVPSVSTSFDSAVGTYVPTVFDDLQQRVEAVTSREEILDDDDEREIAMERCLFAARAATALSEAECVAEALRFIAVSTSMASSESSGSNRKRSAGLLELQVRSAAVSGMGYSVWARLLCEGLSANILNDLTWERRLVVEMGWGYKSDGDEQKSVSEAAAVRFPTTASTAVVNMLLGACKSASKAGGFSLPVEAVEFVRDAMTKIVVRVYRDALKIYVEDGTGDGTVDTAVMQMLFDVQCLQILLGDIVVEDQGHRLNEMSSNTSSSGGGSTSLKQLEGEIQSRIDPIDLASCRKALRESVGSYVARTGTLYGPVARRRDGRTAWAGVLRGGMNVTVAANLVSLSPAVERFTYLPAPMPSTYTSGGAVGTAGIHAKAVVGALRSEAAAAAAAAASDGGLGRKRESVDTSVVGYASKVSESVGRFGRGFFESLTGK